MSDETQVDKSPDHLYPPFRQRMTVALERAEERIQAELGIADHIVYAETLRSQGRQTWLFAQGRTRPGKKVTWIRSPRYHGIGVAGDTLFRKRGYDVPTRAWMIIQEEAKRQGLCNPALNAGDLGHVQWNPADKPTLAAAAEWVRRDFQGAPVQALPTPGYDVRVFVNGHVLADQEGFLDGDGRTWVMVRPLADDLRYVIAEIQADRALLVATDWDAEVPAADRTDAEEPDKLQTGVERFEKWLPLQLRMIGGNKRGFVPLKDLEAFARTLTWDQETRTAKIWD